MLAARGHRFDGRPARALLPGAGDRQTRSAFQDAMQRKFIDEVERLSGREVLAFISNQHVGPDIEVELFVLRDEK